MNGQTVLDGTVAILWGSYTRELTWVHLSPKNGRVSVANVRATGFWVRGLFGDVPNLEGIAADAHLAWAELREGRDMADWATHRLAPPSMREIEPLEAS